MATRPESMSESKDDKSRRINDKLLPFKFHFFFAYGSIGAVQPFLPIFAKAIGINATAFGIGYSVSPVFNFLFNPIIGFLVDFFQNIKTFLIILLITDSFAYASVLCLPPINVMSSSDATYIRVSYFYESEALLNISKPFERSCLEKVLLNYTECKLTLSDEDKTIYSNETNNSNRWINITYDAEQFRNVNQTLKNTDWVTFQVNDPFVFDRKNFTSSVNIQCYPSISQCYIRDDFHDIFSAYQFWVFFVLVILGSIASTSSGSLSSVACLEVLGANSKAYGRQRLFGTIGWGVVGPLSGFLNEHFGNSFISVICVMAVFQAIDVLILCSISLPKVHMSSNMSRDLRIIFTSKEILTFSLGVTAIGFLSALLVVSEFWFLEDIGASRTLLGLSVLMQCLAGEAPFLFFSGWFVTKLGHFLCFSCVFFGFLLRLVFYYLLKDPWLVLPVDTLHGLTFGLFHGTMACFAKDKAPKGLEASLLGLFSGLYGGLGFGLGSSFGGYGIDKLGARYTFFIGCIMSLICFLIFLIASYIFRRPPDKDRFSPDPLEMKELTS